jgi:hypothetical protein
MEYVVNEWLLDYFRYDDGTVERKKLFKFLAYFSSNDDVILIKTPSPFNEKLYNYAKDLQNDHKKYQYLKWFIKTIFRNRDKCKIFPEWEYPTPSLNENLNSKLNQGNFDSDRYLFETAMFITKNEKIIITTDEKLVEHVKEISEFKLILLDDFLKKYCNSI